MRNFLLFIALVTGLILPIGAAHRKVLPRSPPPARMARRLPGQSGRAPAEAMAAFSRRARRRRQPVLSPHPHQLRPRRAPAPLRARVAAPVKSGSIPPAKSTTAPVIAGTARPSTAVTCPRQRHGRRALGRTTVRLAPRSPIEAAVCPSRLKPTSIWLRGSARDNREGSQMLTAGGGRRVRHRRASGR
jgi:hypothetical protein